MRCGPRLGEIAFLVAAASTGVTVVRFRRRAQPAQGDGAKPQRQDPQCEQPSGRCAAWIDALRRLGRARTA